MPERFSCVRLWRKYSKGESVRTGWSPSSLVVGGPKSRETKCSFVSQEDKQRSLERSRS